MKVMTFFGTRSEIIKFSLITKVLDQHCDHVTVHTGEDSDETLKGVFFRDLEMRLPNVSFDVGLQPEQLSAKIREIFAQDRPDRVLVLSGPGASPAGNAAAKLEIPVYRLEAGRRSFDSFLTDEARRQADQGGQILMTSTHRAKENLILEGIDPRRVFVTGNPLAETLDSFSNQIESSPVMSGTGVKPFDYFVATAHHAENLGEAALTQIFDSFAQVAFKFGKKVLFVAHPLTALKLAEHAVRPSSNIRLLKALNYFDFITLVKNSLGVMTDSGSVQDECAILRVPSVTLRTSTDRPETLECGSNILSGTETEDVVRSMELALAQPASWTPPQEYSVLNVSQIVSKIVLGSGGASA